VAILWQDSFIGAQELRRHGVGYAQARERLATLPTTEQAGFRVTDEQDQAIRRRFHAVDRQLRRRGVRYMLGKNMDDPECRWYGSTLVGRAWTRARCSTASSAARCDHAPLINPHGLIVLS
jgi:hypothetical protein